MQTRPLGVRLFQYQKERFPLLAHLPLVAVMVAAALRLGGGLEWQRWAVMVVVLTGLFFQLRVADEFKDAETDRLYRPERPVPRGLISLRELAALAGIVAALQIGLIAMLGVDVLPWLLLVYAYGVAMTFEFGVGAWLRRHPVLYLLSHMVITPLIGLLALRAAGPWPETWVGFALLCYANGLVLEIGRKIWKPEEEREGVETYSALWGRWALPVWSLAQALGLVGLLIVYPHASSTLWMAIPAITLAALRGGRKRMEFLSALWVLVSFLIVLVDG